MSTPRVLLGMFEAERSPLESLPQWRARLWALLRTWGHRDQAAFAATLARLSGDDEAALSLGWGVALYVSVRIQAAARGRGVPVADPAAYWATMTARKVRAVHALETVEREIGRTWPHAVPR